MHLKQLQTGLTELPVVPPLYVSMKEMRSHVVLLSIVINREIKTFNYVKNLIFYTQLTIFICIYYCLRRMIEQGRHRLFFFCSCFMISNVLLLHGQIWMTTMINIVNYILFTFKCRYIKIRTFIIHTYLTLIIINETKNAESLMW